MCERSEVYFVSKMQQPEYLVLNFLYCFGCGRNWMARGIASESWTKWHDEDDNDALEERGVEYRQQRMVDILVECQVCKIRRIEYELDEKRTGVTEGDVTYVGGLLGEVDFYLKSKEARRKLVPDSRRYVVVLTQGHGGECVVARYEMALERDLMVPILSVEQVMRGLRKEGLPFEIGTLYPDGVVGKVAKDFVELSDEVNCTPALNGEKGWMDLSELLGCLTKEVDCKSVQ
jgi:hypothetical protein